jgi:hypothetical protein
MEPQPTIAAVSKSAYARAKATNRSTITRWAQAGRIVLDGNGDVLVAESEAMLAATADPGKAGVVKHHEIERGQAVIDLTVPVAPNVKAEKPEGYGKRIHESARREAANADLAEMERDRQLGKLTDVEGVKKAMIDFATLTRQTYERIAFDLKLRLAVETDPDRVFDLLKHAIDDAARKIGETLKAQHDLAGSTRQ